MALQLSLQFPILPKTSSYPQIKLTHKPITITRTTKRNITQFTIKATTTDEENNNNNNNVSEPQIVSAQQSTPSEQQPLPTNSSTSDLSDLGSEIKKAMKERDGDGGGYLWSGVAEEIREIEWPAFGKVVGTTGVVLGVIAGSSVVLLTVNAVLAELSDRLFAGRGLQDFFG